MFKLKIKKKLDSPFPVDVGMKFKVKTTYFTYSGNRQLIRKQDNDPIFYIDDQGNSWTADYLKEKFTENEYEFLGYD